jgi:hypothetical protein
MALKPPPGKWLLLLSLLSIIALLSGVLLWRSLHVDNFTRAWILRSLSERFDTEVELADLHVTPFPEMSVKGKNLTIYHRERRDIPFIHIDAFSFHLGVLGIFRVPHQIRGVGVQNMTITVLPRDKSKSPAHPAHPGESTKPSQKPLPAIVVDEIVCDDTTLLILPKDSAKPPLDWRIHALNIYHAGAEQSMEFRGTLTNAKPEGEIATQGSFGPWNLDDKGATPVSGSYKFTNADLGPFPGIAGILSSNGKYGGELDTLEVSGETDTPDFSLDRVGKPAPLHTEYSATVDGLTGDTYLHPVRATLIKSVIVAEGSVVKVPDRGHNISLTIHAPDARIQDILALALKAETPLLTGPAKIDAKLFLPPGKIKVIEKMTLDADVNIENAQWNSPKIRAELESLSRHGEGKPGNQEVGSAVSDLKCKFHLEKGFIHFSNVTFSVPGARINLAGNYAVQGGALDFKGVIQLDAKVSQMVTGIKSVLLIPFDPLFSKHGAGTELPVTITGTAENPTFSVTIFHKKFEKTTGNTEEPATSAKPKPQ